MSDYTLSVKITADENNLKKAVKKSESALSEFTKKFPEMSSSAKNAMQGISSSANSMSGALSNSATQATKNLDDVGNSIENSEVKVNKLSETFQKISTSLKSAPDAFQEWSNKVQQAAREAGEAMERAGDKIKSVGDSISKVGGKLTLGVTVPVVAAGKSMFEAASDFDENMNKIDVAFGSSSKEVESWADTATESFGLSINQALESTSLFGDMATSMGISQKEAASMSTELAGLGGDLASFKNVDIDQAMNALKGVFTGETESLKNLGVVMTETNLADYAMQQGIGKSVSEMTQAEKVSLRYSYVLDATKNAAGDYANTSDGAANSMRTLSSEIDNAKVALGQNLLPVFTPIIQKITELVTKFSDMSPEMQQTILKIAGFAAAIGPVLGITGKLTSGIGGVVSLIGKLGMSFGTLSPTLSPIIILIGALVAAFAYLMTTNDDFRNSISATVTSLGEQLKPILDQLMEVIGSLVQAIVPIISQLVTELAPVILNIVTLVGGLITSILPIVLTLIQALMPIISSIIQCISNVIPPVMQVVGVIIEVIQKVISALVPIIGIVADVISAAMNFIAPIVDFIGMVITGIVQVVVPLVMVITSVFSSIFDIVSTIMSSVKKFISGVFNGIKSAWSTLTGFVDGVFNGIDNAVSQLIDCVKGLVNVVIGSINAAIGLINLIPGVNIKKIPKLARGTDDWQGGFAYMNEGGRGELVNLPNGSQVIPHDISVKYAKESARAGGSSDIDLSGFMEGMVIQIVNNTSVDGTPLKETISDYTIQKIGSQQRAVEISRGAAYV